jgi:hypothetical protein
MVEFGLGGRRWAIEEAPEEAWVFMEPDEFMSFRFRRAARELNTLLTLFYDHGEMPEFLRQLRRVVEDRPPEDPPPAAVLSWLPDDGPPSSGSCTPLVIPRNPNAAPGGRK